MHHRDDHSLPEGGRSASDSGHLEHSGAHDHGPHHGPRDGHGNPIDLAAYVARLEDPERDAWQRPDELIAALQLAHGATVGEIGCGPGVFTRRLAAAVGPDGRVFAVDVEPRLLALLNERMEQRGMTNVTPVLGRMNEPQLPARSCDLLLFVNAYHHLTERTAYLRRITSALRPGGRLAIVDFHKRDNPVGPPSDHLLERETVLAEAAAADLQLVGELGLLPHHFVLLLAPAA